ncbi:MAG: hypothetical protein ABW220_07555 [Burkholderiaceae bacterium]
MLSWLKKIAPARPSLDRRLAAYPPYEIPHPGPGQALTLDQAQTNLDYLLAHRQARLAAFAALLRDEAGIDAAPALAGEDPAALLGALHTWLNQVLPPLLDRHPELTTAARWLSSRRSGEEIVFSFLMDLALLVGELIIVGRPSFSWKLDLDPRNRKDGMQSWQRPVLIAHRPDGSQVELDIEEGAFFRFVQSRRSSALINEWLTVVREARAGGYDRAL